MSRLVGHADEVTCAAFFEKSSQFGQAVVSVSFDGSLRVWQDISYDPSEPASFKSYLELDNMVDTVKQYPSLPVIVPIHALAVSPTRSYCLVGTDSGEVCLWNTEENGMRRVGSHLGPVTGLKLLRDDTHLVSASEDGWTVFWDLATGKPVHETKCHEDHINAVKCVEKDNLIVTGSSDSTVRLWDIRQPESNNDPVAILEGHFGAVECLDVSPDGTRIISGSSDTSLLMWDLRQYKSVSSPMVHARHEISSVAFSPDGLRFVTGAGNAVQLWDAQLGLPLSPPRSSHDDEICSVEFSRDGKAILTASADKTVRIWHAESRKDVDSYVDSRSVITTGNDGAKILTGLIIKEEGQPIGSGGFGEVYGAKWLDDEFHLQPSPKAVLKIIRAATGELNMRNKDRFMRRLTREITVWRSAHHQNIVKFLGTCDVQGNLPAIVAEFMTHGTILDYLQNFPNSNRIALSCGILDGLTYFHEHEPKIIHGDLKAMNVLISSHGTPKLTDFGLSRLSEEASMWVSQASNPQGTLRWMAPEIIKGEEKQFTLESDMYALGMTLYEIFTDKIPFHEYHLTQQIPHAVVERNERPTLPNPSPHITKTLWNLIVSCWQTEPSDRPAARNIFKKLRDMSSTYRPLRLLTIDSGKQSLVCSIEYIRAIMDDLGGGRPSDYFDMIAASGHGRILAHLIDMGVEAEDLSMELFHLICSHVDNLECSDEKSFVSSVGGVIRNVGRIKESNRHGLSSSGREPCKLILVSNSLIQENSAAWSTNYESETSDLGSASLARCAKPELGIWEALTFEGNMVTPNPVLDVLKEAKAVFGDYRQIGCIVSCGFNSSKVGTTDVENMMANGAHEAAKAICSKNGNYFRFAATQQLVNEANHVISDPLRMLMGTRKIAAQYMRQTTQKEQVKMVAKKLRHET